MLDALKSFAGDQSGATAIEYGLLAALIGVGIVAGATTFGTEASGVYNYLGDTVEAGMDRNLGSGQGG